MSGSLGSFVVYDDKTGCHWILIFILDHLDPVTASPGSLMLGPPHSVLRLSKQLCLHTTLHNIVNCITPEVFMFRQPLWQRLVLVVEKLSRPAHSPWLMLACMRVTCSSVAQPLPLDALHWTLNPILRPTIRAPSSNTIYLSLTSNEPRQEMYNISLYIRFKLCSLIYFNLTKIPLLCSDFYQHFIDIVAFNEKPCPSSIKLKTVTAAEMTGSCTISGELLFHAPTTSSLGCKLFRIFTLNQNVARHVY